MRFLTLMARNLFRRRTRTLLTAFGIAVAVAAVLDLVGVAWNFENSFLTLFVGKGIDLVVVRAGTSNQLSSALDQKLADRIRSIDGVKDVAASLVDTVSFEEAQIVSAIVNGWQSGSLLFRGSHLLEGRWFEAREDGERVVDLGRVLAMNLGKKAGDDLDVAGEKFRVIGVFESDSAFESGAMIVPLATLQKLMGRENQVTGIVVAATSPDQSSIDALRARIESTISGVAATPARDYVQRDVQIQLVKLMAWTTTVLALVLGAVGMLNTMMMTVFERTQEIGVLRALGWRRSRVLRLILGESACLGLIGAVIGVGLAMIGLRILLMTPTARGFVEPRLPLPVLASGLLMGLGLSFLGGAYPAIRAASLDRARPFAMNDRESSDGPILRTAALTKTYPNGEVQALRGVSVAIEARESIAIVGPSGCGKSTLMHLLGGLDRPTSGDVSYRGTSLSRLDRDRYRALEIGFVFQSFYILGTLNAVENVQVPMFESSLTPRQRIERAESLIDLVGLSHRRKHRPMQLSVGERQRVAIARALANQPSVLLADEPTGNLDSRSQDEVLRLLEDLRLRQGLTLVIVTHSNEVAAAAGRVIRMRDGQVEAG